VNGVAFVTAAARRIGRALAVEAARAGFDVAVHHRASADDAEETAALVRAEGRKALVLAGDLTAADAGTLIARAEALGPVTLLVNNASLFLDDRLDTTTAADLDAHMATNVRAPVMLAQAFVAALQADRAGLIVNLIDQRVWRPTPQYFSYSLSKAALWYATQTMAQALAPRIRVNAIGPGPTFGSTHQAPGSFEAEAAGTPLGRQVTGEDIAAALEASIARPHAGRAYNLCDDEPAPPHLLNAYACALMGVEPPPTVPYDEAALPPIARRFWSESKRVSNARAKAELGWRPAFPTWREGLSAIYAAENARDET
jgi:NAD(P)-dependent dehydrogenase (short-subunit alcohol dehydrogenase family)